MNDHYALLSVGRQATTAEIANAYRQLLVRERQDKGDKADFGVYSLAYRTLTNHSKRLEYDRFMDELSGKYAIKDPETPTEAERCYLAGLTCMEQKNYQDAVDYLYRAVQLEPETSHFCSQLGLALGMFKDRLAEAERYCKKAISLDPDNPDFRFNLGFLYQRHNLVDAAQTAFDLANEAINSRRVRLLRENEPLITPWGEEGQDLLDELSRLESMVNGVEGKPEEGPPSGPMTAAEPAPAVDGGEPAAATPAPLEPVPSPEDLVTETDLLRQLDDLKSQISKEELAGALAATADQADAPMERFLDDDLLKELDLLEAQVRGVEEFHNGEAERAGLEAGRTAAVATVTTVPEPEAPEVQVMAAEPSPPAAEAIRPPALEPAVAAALEKTAEETFHQVSLLTEDAPPPEGGATGEVGAATLSETAEPGRGTGIVLPEALLQELSAPEPAPPITVDEPQAPSVEASLQSTAAVPAAPPETAAGRETEASAALLAETEPASGDRQLPRGAAGDKIRMLEELEREMMGELDNIRREKEKLQAAG